MLEINEKYNPSSLRCRDSNSQQLDDETPFLTNKTKVHFKNILPLKTTIFSF